MSKVHEAWDLANSQSYSTISSFPTKPTIMCGQKWVVLLVLWPKPHACMVIHYIGATLK